MNRLVSILLVVVVGIAATAALLAGSNLARLSRPDPCERPTTTMLCVEAGEGSLEVQRLSETNVLDATPKASSGAKGREPQLRQLVEVTVGEVPLELHLTPGEGLQLVEVRLFESVATLGSEPPLEVATCETTCGSWHYEATETGRLIRLPTNELAAGNVVVVSTFVERPQEVGAVSWGLILLE